jgi:ABC-type polysaccharide/polyol phosphate export permease
MLTMPTERGTTRGLAATPPVSPVARRTGSRLGAVGRLAVAPFRSLVVHRQAIRIFVGRDIRGRYVNSALGLWWAVIQPLALLTLYTFVFSIVMKQRLSQSDGTGEFALYLFCGLLPWLAFADATTRSASVIVDQTPLIKKVVFPTEILPVHVVLSGLVVEAVGLVVLLVAVTALGRPPGWSLAVLPGIVVLQVLFTTGLAWLLAAVAVFIRDVRQVVGLGLTLWMFLTPIVYPASLVPDRYRWVLAVNPMSFVVDAYRAAVLDHRLPAAVPTAIFAAIALAAFVAGYWAFSRSKRAFADLL